MDGWNIFRTHLDIRAKTLPGCQIAVLQPFIPVRLSLTIPVDRRLADTVLKSKGFRIAQALRFETVEYTKRMIPGISCTVCFQLSSLPGSA